MGNLVLSVVGIGGGGMGCLLSPMEQRWRSGNNGQGRRRNGQ
jgi:hypothetical protein